MANVTDLSEYKRKRKKKALHGRLLRLLFLLALVGVIVAAVQLSQNETLMAYLSTNVTGSDVGQGYPLKLATRDAKAIGIVSGDIAVLTETNLKVFDANAKEIRDIQHGYKVPVMQCVDKHILLYDRGSGLLRLETKFLEVYQKQMEYPIITAALSERGVAGVVTSRDGFGSTLSVFDASGTAIFQYNTKYGVVALGTQNDWAVLGCVDTNMDGSFRSMLTGCSFKEEQPLFELTFDDELIYSVSCAGGAAAVVTDKACYRVDKHGKITGAYPFEGRSLTQFQNSSNAVSLLFADWSNETEQDLVILNNRLEESASIPLAQPVKDIVSTASSVFYLSGKAITEIDSASGRKLSDTAVLEDESSFAVRGHKIYALSLSTVSEYGVGAESRKEEPDGNRAGAKPAGDKTGPKPPPSETAPSPSSSPQAGAGALPLPSPNGERSEEETASGGIHTEPQS